MDQQFPKKCTKCKVILPESAFEKKRCGNYKKNCERCLAKRRAYVKKNNVHMVNDVRVAKNVMVVQFVNMVKYEHGVNYVVVKKFVNMVTNGVNAKSVI